MASKVLQILDHNSRYAVINKPSGLRSDGFTSNSLLPQVTKYFKSLDPHTRLDSSKFNLVHRLDKYVTGGLIVSTNKNFTRRVNKLLRSKGRSNNWTFTRRYVGLVSSKDLRSHMDQLPSQVLDDHSRLSHNIRDLNSSPPAAQLTFFDGAKADALIDSHILVHKDGKPLHQRSQTLIRILYDKASVPSSILRTKYPCIFNQQMYPILIELCTGRKNQIRDHFFNVLQLPLLNDDNFLRFKERSTSPSSTTFKSSQIGLHSAYIRLDKEAYHFPLIGEDKELWTDFVDNDGSLRSDIREELSNW